MTLADFAALVRRHDGIDAFNEASRIALAAGRPGRVEVCVTDGPSPIALAFATDAVVELAVHPEHRGHGHGTALVERLVAEGETRFWAHGDLLRAQRLAAACGLDAHRTLLTLRRTVGRSFAAPSVDGIVIRTYRPDDAAALLALNARAFAEHPEQGSLDADGLVERMQAKWFDSAGLFVAEHDGTIVGFHWTKVERGVGEVYVLAVDETERHTGLGSLLLATGLTHLDERGVTAVDLYVEADNNSALALYRRAGFIEYGRDVLYVSTQPEAAHPDQS